MIPKKRCLLDHHKNIPIHFVGSKQCIWNKAKQLIKHTQLLRRNSDTMGKADDGASVWLEFICFKHMQVYVSQKNYHCRALNNFFTFTEHSTRIIVSFYESLTGNALKHAPPFKLSQNINDKL